MNADGLVTTGDTLLSSNMFAYCENNPINYSDITGNCRKGYPCNYGVIMNIVKRPGDEVNCVYYHEPENPTEISFPGVAFIEEYEQYYPDTYDDGFGNPTIGYGHVINSGEKFSTLTRTKAHCLLLDDLKYWETSVTNYSNKLGKVWSQNQYDAFVSLAFNTGYNYRYVMDMIVFDNMDPYIAFGKIIHAGGVKQLGLYRRRMDEADMFVNGTYNRTFREW